jgi:hypothetical protein
MSASQIIQRSTSAAVAAAAATRAILQTANEQTAIYFVASIVGLISLIVIAYSTGALLMEFSTKGRGSLARSLIKRARCDRLIQLLRDYLIHSLGLSEVD